MSIHFCRFIVWGDTLVLTVSINFEITKNDLYHSVDFDRFCCAHVTPDAGSV